jgi:hypothetical protein
MKTAKRMRAKAPTEQPTPRPIFADSESPEALGVGEGEVGEGEVVNTADVVLGVFDAVLVGDFVAAAVWLLSRAVTTPSLFKKKPCLSTQQVGSLSQQ